MLFIDFDKFEQQQQLIADLLRRIERLEQQLNQKKIDDLEQYSITPTQAIKLLHITKKTLNEWCLKGKIKYTRNNKGWKMFNQNEINRINNLN